MRRHGVVDAPRRSAVPNASTGQRTNIRPFQLDIKSHVTTIPDISEQLTGTEGDPHAVGEEHHRIERVCLAKASKAEQDTKGLMPEEVADLGVDDFHCITTVMSGSPSDEV